MIKITQIKPRVFFAKFEHQKDLFMTALRLETEPDYPSHVDRLQDYGKYLEWYMEKYTPI